MSTAEVVFTTPAGPAKPKWEFIAFDEQYTLYYFVGPFGGSKTNAICASALKTALDYPGSVICICRADLAVLRRTTMNDFLELCKEVNIAVGEDAIKHNKKDSIVEMPEQDGKVSRVYFFGLVSGDYERKLKSLQPFRFYIDEANEISERMMQMALARCRAKVPHRETGELGKIQIKMAANDMGNNWLWRRFVGKPHPGDDMNPAWADENVGIQTLKVPSPQYANRGSTVELPDGRRAPISRKLRRRYTDDAGKPQQEILFEVEGDDGPERYALDDVKLILETAAVYIFTDENWSLNQQNIENFYFVDEAMRKQYLEGRPPVDTGLMFPEFKDNVHILGNDEIPHTWNRIVAIDHGLDHPTAAVFMAVNPNGDIVVYDEYEQSGLGVSNNAYNIKGMLDNNRNIKWRGDPAMWQRLPNDPSRTIASIYHDAGCRPIRKADNRRDYGFAMVKEFLTPRQYLGFQSPVPRLWVMQRCTRLIERLQNFSHEEAKKKVNDDLIDALRYGVTSVYQPKAEEALEDESRPASWGHRYDILDQEVEVTEGGRGWTR